MLIQHDMPDPYPGRCGCSHFNTKTMQYERCLGYANEPHICEWENADPPPASWLHKSRAPFEPKPWVKPGDKNEDGK